MKKIVLFLIIILSLFLYRNSLNIYFFQDDFFMLSITHPNNLSDIASFFIPRSDVQFYRPLSHELFYFLGRSFLDWNPFLFHLAIFAVFIGVIALFYKLGRYFLNHQPIRLFSSFLFATSAIHYNSLNWIVNFSYILVAFFFFLGLILYFDKRPTYQIILVYILGLLSNEFMIVFPIIICLYKFKKSLFSIFFTITAIYSFNRFILFPPQIGSYNYTIGKEILSSYRFFFLFFLNFPETIKDQMLSLLKIKEEFIQSFRWELAIFFINFVLILLIFTLPLFQSKRIISKKFIFLFLFFIITLLPIVGIPAHTSPHQGTIAFAGFLLFILLPLDTIWPKIPRVRAIMVIISGIIWIYSSFLNINLNDRIHWIKRRSDIVKDWISKIDKKRNIIIANSILIIGTDDKETKVALKDGEGIREYVQLPNITVKFSPNPEYRGKLIVK